jgi:EAL and modified HD-GYP domain-containing signal transduction protein
MPHTVTPSRAVAPAFVARQPILDRRRRVCGYELLFRHSADARYAAVDGDVATAIVISDSLLSIGLDTLTGGHKAFINVGRRLLLDGIPTLLPADRVVLELGADIDATDDVLAACRDLRRAGYSLAIDDFVLTEGTADLVPLVDFLKVDFVFARRAAARARIVPAAKACTAALIAKKVETIQAFDAAVREGYTLFQGFFFGQPVTTEGRKVPSHQIVNIRLLRALQEPDISVDRLEQLIKQDAELCYRVLRTLNSAAFALRATVHSIREALVLLGCDTIRRWASLWALVTIGEQAHPELVAMAMTRARCCELVGGRTGGSDAAAEGFLLGTCSLLDVILGVPMEALLGDLPLAADTRIALLGGQNAMRQVLECALACEQGQWDRAGQLARALNLDPADLAAAHVEALRWTRDLRLGMSASVTGA